MKKLAIVLTLALASFSSVAQEKSSSMTATYDGYDGSIYTFVDEFDEYHLFDEVTNEVLEKYDLSNDVFTYETFEITYVTTKNGDGDVLLRITNLVLVEIEEDEFDY